MRQLGKLGAGAETFAADDFREPAVRHRVDIGAAVIEPLHLRGIDVEADGLESSARDGGAQRQAHIAEPDDAGNRGAVRNGGAERVRVCLVSRVKHCLTVRLFHA